MGKQISIKPFKLYNYQSRIKCPIHDYESPLIETNLIID